MLIRRCHTVTIITQHVTKYRQLVAFLYYSQDMKRL